MSTTTQPASATLWEAGRAAQAYGEVPVKIPGGPVVKRRRLVWHGVIHRKIDGRPVTERCFHNHTKRGPAEQCGQKAARRLNRLAGARDGHDAWPAESSPLRGKYGVLKQAAYWDGKVSERVYPLTARCQPPPSPAWSATPMARSCAAPRWSVAARPTPAAPATTPGGCDGHDAPQDRLRGPAPPGQLARRAELPARPPAPDAGHPDQDPRRARRVHLPAARDHRAPRPQATAGRVDRRHRRHAGRGDVPVLPARAHRPGAPASAGQDGPLKLLTEPRPAGKL